VIRCLGDCASSRETTRDPRHSWEGGGSLGGTTREPRHSLEGGGSPGGTTRISRHSWEGGGSPGGTTRWTCGLALRFTRGASSSARGAVTVQRQVVPEHVDVVAVGEGPRQRDLELAGTFGHVELDLEFGVINVTANRMEAM